MTLDYGTLAPLFPLLLLLPALIFTVLIDPYIRPQQRRIMLIIAALCLSLIVQNLVENELSLGPARPRLRTLAAIFGYCVRPVFLVLFLYLVRPKGKHRLWWLLVGLNALVNVTALFSGLCFTIGADNHYHGGPLAGMTLYVSAILLGTLIWQSIRNSREGGRQEKGIPILVAAMVVASVFMDGRIHYEEQPVSFLTMAITVGSVFYYIWLHLQLVREHERDLMAEQRIQIMMTQIQPHFLYNTLSTIQVLCSIDPPQAAEITGKFSVYLRQNLDSLEFTGMTSFEKELEHTRTYADIERVRFPNVRVEYAIEDADFSLPPLTVQPLVENAIRHGVRIREEGVVRVLARKAEGGHEVVISDNGVGFDAAEAERKDGTHIGLKNVRERIERMCGGSVTVLSRPGEGTTVTVFVPEREKEERG